MIRIARVVLIGVLMIGGVVRLGWSEENAAQHWEKLNEKVVGAYQQGKYQDGIAFAEQSYKYALEHFGAEHPKTLTAMNNLSGLYNTQGLYSQAEELLKEVVRLREKVLGAEDTSTMNASNRLALFYESQKRYEKAESLFKKIYELQKRVLGAEHQDAIVSLAHLAKLYHLQGRNREAASLIDEALQTAERHWNELNKKTATALKKGDYEQGINLAKQAYEYATKALGKTHQNTIISVNNLARLHVAQGQTNEAELLYKKAIQLSEKILGHEHPVTLASINSLGMVYVSMGRYSDAESYLQEALRLRKKVLGSEHEHTLTSINNLAGFYKSQGNYSEAEPLLKDALQLRKKVLGNEHPATLVSMNNLAGLYESQGHYQDAGPLYKDVLRLRKQVLGKEHPDTLVSMSNLAGLYESQGRYQDAEPIYKEGLHISAKVLGDEHPDTLAYGNNLAFLYQAQGRYLEAEPTYKEVFRLRRKVLGDEHPDTLISMNNLAVLYESQGRYNDAELNFKEVLRLREKVLGKAHPQTITSIHNLAALYKVQGHYGKAEPIFKEAFQLSNRVLGEEHPQTMTSINMLAGLYKAQHRYKEAEPLYKKAFELRRKILGPENPATLSSMNSLALLYDVQGRYEKAGPLLKDALRLTEKILRPENPKIFVSMNNLAALYLDQGRYNEAESLLEDVFRLSNKTLGRENPDTIYYSNNLAGVYESQGNYSKAEPLLEDALRLSKKVMDKNHPFTLVVQSNYIMLLVKTDRPVVALRQLQKQEELLLSRSFQELYTSSSEKVRRLYLQSTSKFQKIVFSLANHQSEKEYQQYAAEVMLRWKQVYADESRVQHQLLTLNNDEESKKINEQISASQKKLSQALRQQEEKPDIPKLIEKANQDETALLALARHLRTGLEVKDVKLDKVLSALPQDGGLVEYRLFSSVDFKTGDLGEHHLAALLLFGDPDAQKRFIFLDLGPLAEIVKLMDDLDAVRTNIKVLRDEIEKNGKEEDIAALQKQFKEADRLNTAACQKALAPLENHIKNLKQLYIAPDGRLNLLSFASMRLPDGRFLAERQQINRLQTGRDLLENKKDVPASKGMVAVGGVNYGPQPVKITQQADLRQITPRVKGAARQLDNGFGKLSGSRRETKNIFSTYTEKYKNNTQGKRFISDDASEYNLKHLKQPPRILHLSTHGFYLTDEKKELADEAPLLLSGLALAGANNGLQGKLDEHGDDGLLYSLEVLGLNLQGTELVSLSACDTGKGVVDYSEGVYGLVRAFRTAGAKNVLMTLTPVGDTTSKDFMEKFYDHYLAENLSPSRALHKTRLDFIRNGRPVKDWSPYVMVGR
ncbi:MAG: tetratricopeptide repeat protein [Candidatus Electrothrix communis]|nr:MAG: tetratricopeptide repeat protein [Candidatus Electrothrix communis]